MIDYHWKTPIYTSSLLDTEEYVNDILSRYDLDNPPSDMDDANIFDSGFEDLRSEILQHLFSYIENVQQPDQVHVKSWITGSSKDYSMISHNHSGAQVSGVVYLQAEEGGDLILSDPRGNANRGYPLEFKDMMEFDRVTIKPETGMIVLFPSFVYHEVPPYKGTSRRIALPVDFFFKE